MGHPFELGGAGPGQEKLEIRNLVCILCFQVSLLGQTFGYREGGPPVLSKTEEGDLYWTECKLWICEGCCLKQEGTGKVREVRDQESGAPALRLEAAHMRKMQLLSRRFHEAFHRLFPRLWRVYKKNRLLRIASVVAAVPLALILFGNNL